MLNKVSSVLAYISALFAGRCMVAATLALIQRARGTYKLKGSEGTIEILLYVVGFVIFAIYPLAFLIKREREREAGKIGNSRL